VFRPGTPCETQEPPDMNAPGGAPDQAFTATGDPIPQGAAIKAPKRVEATDEQRLQYAWLQEYLRRGGLTAKMPDPLTYSVENYPRELAKVGLATTPRGKIYRKGDEAARAKAMADEEQVR
jgi:hypothetical protein